MAQLTLRVSEDDKDLINSYAKFNGLSTSELLRSSVIKEIEENIDLKLYDESMAILNDKDDKEISFDEMVNNLGLPTNVSSNI